MGFVANSYTFKQCKHFENPLRFDKVTESLKCMSAHISGCCMNAVP